MAGGANKKFIETGPKFLRRNVVLSPNPQSYLIGKAGAQNIAASNVSLIGIYDFDLRKDPGSVYRDTAGKRVDVYKLYLMEQRVAHNLAAPKDKSRSIRAFYLPWDNGRGWTVQLDDRADFMFTPTLDGCSVVAESGQNPRVSHINFQNHTGTRIDPNAIDNHIAAVYGVGAKPGLRTLEKDDYSSDAEKAAGKQFTVTVVGFRDRVANTWNFYYQRQISRVVPDPSGIGSLVQNILQDRQVPIV